MAAGTVTFNLPEGTEVTCSPELAAKLGHKPSAPSAPKPEGSKKSEK